MAEHQSSKDQDAGKGAVEGDGRARNDRGQSGNTSLDGQNPHRTESNLVKSNDSDFPEPGLSPEHSGNEEFTLDQQGRPHRNSGVAQRGSTLSHEERGAMNPNSKAPGLRSPENRDRQDVEIPAEGADIENRGPQKHGIEKANREPVNQDPGQRQKENQNKSKDDPLAA